MFRGRGSEIPLGPPLRKGDDFELIPPAFKHLKPLPEHPVQELAKVEIRYKLIVVGDPAVGKTSLINKFKHNKIDMDYLPTLGISITTKQYHIQGIEEKLVHFMIWDVAGQDMFEKVRTNYYRGANIVFLTYDITRRETFGENGERLQYWIDDF